MLVRRFHAAAALGCLLACTSLPAEAAAPVTLTGGWQTLAAAGGVIGACVTVVTPDGSGTVQIATGASQPASGDAGRVLTFFNPYAGILMQTLWAKGPAGQTVAVDTGLCIRDPSTTINDATDVTKKANVVAGNLYVQPNPATLTVADRSATVATGGTPVLVMGANALRKDGWIVNPPSATTTLFLSTSTSSFGAAAGAGVDAALAPGQSFALGGSTGVIKSDVYATASDAGHVVLAKELQ